MLVMMSVLGYSFIQSFLFEHLLCLCIMFDFPLNILYNMLLAYTLFCMLYLYSSVKISVDLMLITTHDSNVPFNSELLDA